MKTNKKKSKESKQLTRHHLNPQERIKKDTINIDYSYDEFPRILYLWRDRHTFWHYLFHNLTLHEIILVLQRIERIKFKET